MSQKLYDISPAITPELAVFPGDTPMSREILLDIDRGDHIRLSTLRATVHLGAHADAPSHYGKDGRAMEAQPLELYLGPCRVIHVKVKRGERVMVDHLAHEQIDHPRILLRTDSYLDPQNWNDDFAPIDPAAVDWLADRGVKLVGVDTPSVDAGDAKVLEAHQRFLARDVAILEGLVLSNIPGGVYELIALPLKLVGFDGSPVRAVLRAIELE